jgi:hypothetical protein
MSHTKKYERQEAGKEIQLSERERWVEKVQLLDILYKIK